MSVYYKELLIFDKESKKARKIEFQKGINIVTSKLNSVGKTSLSLMILYGFGAKVKFSDKWNMNNIFTKLTLQQNDKEIIIIRYRDTYSIIADGERFFYPIQNQGYSEKLYELLGLTIKIKDKNSDTYSTAIPSLYLLPYFISQTKTDEDRSVFLDLNMYMKSDLHDALYYHVGVLDNEYTSLVQELTQAKKALDKLKKEKEEQSAEIAYLESKLNQNKNIKTVDSDKDLEADIAVYEKYAKKKKNYYEMIKEASEIKRKIKLLNQALIDNVAYGRLKIGHEDGEANIEKVILPKHDIFDESFSCKVSKKQSDFFCSRFKDIYWFATDYRMEEEYYSGDYGDYDDHDYARDTWDAMTDGQYGDMPEGFDGDYDWLGY